MDKNVPVDQSSNSIDRTIPSSSSSSLFASASEQKATSVPVQITSAFSPLVQKSSIGESESSLSSRKETLMSSSSSISKLKSEVDQLDSLVKDLLSEVNRPVHAREDQPTSASAYSYSQQTHQEPLISTSNGNPRTRTVREERIRIKRGANMENSQTRAAAAVSKPSISSSSIDEQLIDSLLESVQNTLKKRSQHQHQSTGWTNTLPIHHSTGHNRRAHSSSSAYTDSVHRMDPGRSRFPIKLSRADSPTSTLSSRRPYSRQDSRDGYISGSTTTIPTHFRATSEPPPEGPIELRRMDLVRSPSRTYFDAHPQDYQYYSRSTLPPRGIRPRGYDHSGYDTDTGLMSGRGYAPRYYRVAPPPPPALSMYPPYSHQRSMFRPDGYDTDSGLISSGRLHMTRTLPQRMAVIPETVVLNNRMVSASNLNTLPGSQLRANSYRGESLPGYETDSGMNTRQYNYGYRHIPVQRDYIDQRWTNRESPARPMPQPQRYVDPDRSRQEQIHSTSIPVFTQAKRTTSTSPSLKKGKVDTVKKDLSIIPMIFPGSVGLSNPIKSDRTQQQQQKRSSENEVKHVSSKDQPVKRAAGPQGALLEDVVIPPAVDPTPAPKVEQEISTSTEITPAVNIEVPVTKVSSTIPPINQSYNTNVQVRVGSGASRTQDDNSRRSSLSSVADSDVHRSGVYQAHNVSQFWYKEKMSREDAINALKTKAPGAFLIRDSQGFPGSFGLAVKVETLPPGIQPKPGADPNAELVRHYLIERTATGHVRLKGCANEPEFASLSALVHQHTLTSLALPLKLVLPSVDIVETNTRAANTQQQEAKKMTIKDLLEKGAACNVLYLNNVDVESLSGQMAVAKALNSTFEQAERLQAVIVNFKVSTSGITLVDTKKKLFSRRHFPKENVTYCGADYESERVWTYQYRDLDMLPRAKCFGFVSKKINGNRSSTSENECHVFAEIDPSQPASAIVNFVSKVMIGSVPV